MCVIVCLSRRLEELAFFLPSSRLPKRKMKTRGMSMADIKHGSPLVLFP